MGIIDELDKILKEKGLTKYQLEKLTGISRSSLGNIFGGKNSPSLLHIEKICNALDLKVKIVPKDEGDA